MYEVVLRLQAIEVQNLGSQLVEPEHEQGGSLLAEGHFVRPDPLLQMFRGIEAAVSSGGFRFRVSGLGFRAWGLGFRARLRV